MSSQIVLDTTKGFVPPQFTTTQKNAIVSPNNGAIVFDTTLGALCQYNSGTSSWGTLSSANNAPAFSAGGGATSLTSATFTKLIFTTEEFDTNNNFATGRFTPTVAGYYQLNAAVAMGATTAQIIISFYKNGSSYKIAPNLPAAGGGASSGVAGSALVYLNGSTDYVEVYVWQSAATQNTENSATYTWFSGAMVRAA